MTPSPFLEITGDHHRPRRAQPGAHAASQENIDRFSRATCDHNPRWTGGEVPPAFLLVVRYPRVQPWTAETPTLQLLRHITMTWERALVRDEKLHGYPVLTGLEELFDPAGGQRIYQTSHTEFVDSQGRRVGTVECEMVEVLANETFFRHGPLASTLPLPPPEQATPLREDELVPGVELPIRSWTLLRETLEHWAAALATLDKAWSSRAPFDNGFLRAGMLVPTLTSALPPEARLNELSLTIVEPLFLGESHIASARIVEVQENDNCERVLALEIRGRTSEGRLLTRGTAKLIMPGGRPQPHSGIVV